MIVGSMTDDNQTQDHCKNYQKNDNEHFELESYCSHEGIIEKYGVSQSRITVSQYILERSWGLI